MAIDWSALRAPFEESELEWRVGSSGLENGKVKWASLYAYLTARAIQDRLDTVVGPDNWKVEFTPIDKGMLCGVSIRTGDDWVTKWDGSDNTDIEAIKGGISGAMKRAAVQWGVGRLYYELKGMFANIHDRGRLSGQAKPRGGGQIVYFKFDPPKLPPQFLPGGKATKQEPVTHLLGTPDGKVPGEWPNAVIHFGKLQGKTLGEITEQQLAWYKTVWLEKRIKEGCGPDDEPLYRAILQSVGRNPDAELPTEGEKIPF